MTVHDAASGTATASFTLDDQSAGGAVARRRNCSATPASRPDRRHRGPPTAGVVNPNGAGETSHSGTYYAWLDGYGTTHTDTLAQTVSVPAGLHGSR